ncbi:DUF1569 domain-containing protein [Pedobacter sp. ASV28]|uniref:DUF1569 domain-containing protein n=1 Tax=Pedobacter sp. ASV28 TaxID=2795123 RepID=UPI0018EB6AB5|nr:DUF1569 domain-containing protein [Pedobacter sp. ASV28]
MKSIFDKDINAELIERIRALSTENVAEWGEMNCFQMIRHCTKSEEMFLGKRSYPRVLIGRIFGKMILKGLLKNNEPIKKNQPTHLALKIKDTGNFEVEKLKWMELLEAYKSYTNGTFVHPFFGKMTDEQIGRYVFKHTDHHLRQFNS